MELLNKLFIYILVYARTAIDITHNFMGAHDPRLLRLSQHGSEVEVLEKSKNRTIP